MPVNEIVFLASLGCNIDYVLFLFHQNKRRWRQLFCLWNSIWWRELSFRWSSYAEEDRQMGTIYWENVCAWWSAEGWCQHGSVASRRWPLPMRLQNYLPVSFHTFKWFADSRSFIKTRMITVTVKSVILAPISWLEICMPHLMWGLALNSNSTLCIYLTSKQTYLGGNIVLFIKIANLEAGKDHCSQFSLLKQYCIWYMLMHLTQSP